MAGGAQAELVSTGHVRVGLVADAPSIAPGGSIYLALRQKIDQGWHTYWRNPGDAGEPPALAWTLPPGWRAGDFVWPVPHRLPVGPLMNYGYEDEVYLPLKVTAPADAAPGRPVRLRAALSLLVCKDICVPEDATLQIDLPVAAAAEGGSSNAGIQSALAAAPLTAGLDAAMALGGGKLKLAVAGPPLKGMQGRDAYFFPYDSTVIDHAKPQAVERGPQGLTLSIEPGYAFKKGPAPSSLSGVLQTDGRAYEITARTGHLPAAAGGLGPVASAPASSAAAGGGTGQELGLPLAVAFALLGGLILNLMPCVFPILSMKALALASHADAESRPRAQGLAFLFGVLATFMGLAALLIAAKAAGAAVGWGFQLQSPGVVAGLCLLMLLIGLNLSGVFEAGLSLQSAGSGGGHGGLVGSALTGALAVVVAAPCTAPFMAGAIAYALTQSEWAALVIFAALGLGFAAPFTLLSFAPGLLRKLPRPGPWMDTLKKILAFPMFGAAAWLLWVFTLQAGSTALAALLAAGVTAALAAWLYGTAQKAQLSGGRSVLLYGLGLAAAAGAIGLTAVGLNASVTSAAAASGAVAKGETPTEPFSPERLAELRGQGKPIFVNFTAAWCITCQVNERVAMSGAKVAEAFSRNGAVYLKADWTRRDAVIAKTLAEHGRAGVPLYLVYGAGGRDPVVLPQLLTEDVVVDAIENAARPTV